MYIRLIIVNLDIVSEVHIWVQRRTTCKDGVSCIMSNLCSKFDALLMKMKQTDIMDGNNKCVHILNVSHDDSNDTVSCCENVREYDGRVIR